MEGGQISQPVLLVKGMCPFSQYSHKDAPGGEYSPGPSHGVQEVPSLDFVPAAQLIALVRLSLGMVPGSAEEQ